MPSPTFLQKIELILKNDLNPNGKITKSEQEWQNLLTPEVFEIAKNQGTERPFSGEYCGLKQKGDYYCAVCQQFLFDSNNKFESGTSWPSFFQTALPNSVTEHSDSSHGMIRTEIVCSRCNSHLGHVFSDGPKPTGQRYCINSLVLNFKKAGENLDLLQKFFEKNELQELIEAEKKEINLKLNQVNRGEIDAEKALKAIKILVKVRRITPE